MSKSYIFTLDKYYTEDEITKVSPIIENYVNLFADENGVATLKLKNDVSVVIKRDEGLALHMVLDNPDHFTALPKKLTRAKDFLNTFITAMAKAVDAERQKNIDVASAKAKVEAEAEDSLLGYITPEETKEPATADASDTDNTTVKVNGKEITDPEEKQKVIDDVDTKIAELRERMSKVFSDTFTNVLKSFGGDEWLKKYLS